MSRLTYVDGASLRTPRRTRRPAPNRVRAAQALRAVARVRLAREPQPDLPGARAPPRGRADRADGLGRAQLEDVRGDRRRSRRGPPLAARERARPPRAQRRGAAHVLPLAPRAGRGARSSSTASARTGRACSTSSCGIQDEPTGHNKKARTFRIALEGGIAGVEARLAWLEDASPRSARPSGRRLPRTSDVSGARRRRRRPRRCVERARRWKTCSPDSSAKPSAPCTWCALAVTSQHASPAHRSSAS